MSSASKKIELEVDLRLRDLLAEVADVEWTYEMAAAYLRLAYAVGYQDALREPQRGKLFRDLGLPVPNRDKHSFESSQRSRTQTTPKGSRPPRLSG